MSIVRWLAETYGGEWEYRRPLGTWNCSDGRHVARVHTGGHDMDGEALPGFGYFLYDSEGRGTQIFPPVARQKGLPLFCLLGYNILNVNEQSGEQT